MERNIISSIRNASEEYRRLAARLSDDLMRLRNIRRNTEQGPSRSAGVEAEMELQIKKLKELESSLQEIAAVYLGSDKSMEAGVLFTEGYGPDQEFGISRFDNLEKHEKLIPIRME